MGSINDERDAPIFVVGSARSGTTLLQSALGAHPRIAAPPELYFETRVRSLEDVFGDLGIDGNLERALDETLSSPLITPLELDRGEVLERARSGLRTYGGLMDSVMGTIARRSGKARWSDKSPWQPAWAAWSLFPAAQVVHILRDPRDVIASSIRAPWISETALELAQAWRRFNLDVIRDGASAGPDLYLRIRYEDLVRSPDAVLRLVCTFLGETFHPAMLDPARRSESGTVVPVAAPWQDRVAEGIDASSVGRHHDDLSLRQRLMVAAAVSHDLRALGYEAPQRRAVLAGRALRWTAAPDDVRRAVRYLRMRRRLQPADRLEAVRALVQSPPFDPDGYGDGALLPSSGRGAGHGRTTAHGD